MELTDLQMRAVQARPGDSFHGNERFLRALNDLVTAITPRTIIEVGCGEGGQGRPGPALQAVGDGEAGGPHFGCDRSFARVSCARQQLPQHVHLFVADASRMPLRSHCQDLVLGSGGLEHVGQPDEALDEFKRVTRGWVLLSVPHAPWFRLLITLAATVGPGAGPEQAQWWSPRGVFGFVRRSVERARGGPDSQVESGVRR